MFSMTIVFGEHPVPWVLLFKTREAFDTAVSMYKSPMVNQFDGKELNLTDDFGQQIVLKRESIHGVLLEDMDQSALAAIERGLRQIKTQIQADRAGQADPQIMAHMRMRQGGGPAVLTPFNGGGFPRQ